MSLQLDRYMHLRASGASVEQACEQSGIGAGEAELWEADIRAVRWNCRSLAYVHVCARANNRRRTAW